MYEHIVVFKLKPDTELEKQQALVNQLLSFKGRIPGIVDVSAGVNVTEETKNKQGYTLGLRVTFDGLASLRAYGPHPVHQEFVKTVGDVCDNVIVVDYPIQ